MTGYSFRHDDLFLSFNLINLVSIKHSILILNKSQVFRQDDSALLQPKLKPGGLVLRRFGDKVCWRQPNMGPAAWA